jgi:cytochrome c oxidase cbb3-type subunit 2
VLSLSAYKDPLTGQTVRVTEADRKAIDDPGLKADESRLAYKTQSPERQPQYAGAAWARKHGFDFAAVPEAKAASAPR